MPNSAATSKTDHAFHFNMPRNAAAHSPMGNFLFHITQLLHHIREKFVIETRPRDWQPFFSSEEYIIWSILQKNGQHAR